MVKADDPGLNPIPPHAIERWQRILNNEKSFLTWVRNRLVNVLGDDPQEDYIQRLDDLISFQPGEAIIQPRNGDRVPAYRRVATHNLQDLGEYYLIEKDKVEDLRS